MKRYLSILLSALLLLSCVSYAVPSAIAVTDAAENTYSDTAEVVEQAALSEDTDVNLGTKIIDVDMDAYSSFEQHQSVNSSVLDTSVVINPIWVETQSGVTLKSETAGKYITIPNKNGTTAFKLRADIWDTNVKLAEDGILTLRWDMRAASITNANYNMVRITNNNVSSNTETNICATSNEPYVGDGQWHTYEVTVDSKDMWVGSFGLYVNTASVDIKNIELWRKPDKATVTVLDGDNSYSFEAPTSGLTVYQIIEQSGIVIENPYQTITGLEYNGRTYTSNEVMEFACDITVNAVWGENTNLSQTDGKPVVMINLDNYDSFIQHQSVNASVYDASVVQNPIWIESNSSVSLKSETAGKYFNVSVTNGAPAFKLRNNVWDSTLKLAEDGILTFKWDMRTSSITNAQHNMVRVHNNNVSSGAETMITATNNESFFADGQWHTYEVSAQASDSFWIGGFCVYVNTNSLDVKNVQLWWKPTTATVSYRLPDGTISALTKTDVATSGVTAAELVSGMNFRGYYAPTAIKYAGVEYSVDDTTPIVFAQKDETVTVVAEVKPASKFSPETNMSADVKAILGGANNGMRYKASMLTADDTVTEAGWIVTRDEFLTVAGLSPESFYRNSDVKKIEGLNIDANGTKKIFASDNDIDTFAAVLINIPKANYDDIMHARPFVVDEEGIWYGDTVSGSYRQAAQYVRDNATGLDANTIAALDEVING